MRMLGRAARTYGTRANVTHDAIIIGGSYPGLSLCSNSRELASVFS
jgi:hypothetical protein